MEVASGVTRPAVQHCSTPFNTVRKPAAPKAAAARDFAYNVLHAAGAEGMPVDSIVELGRRRGVYSGKKAKAEVVSKLTGQLFNTVQQCSTLFNTGQLSRDEAFVRVAPRVYARRDALNGDPGLLRLQKHRLLRLQMHRLLRLQMHRLLRLQLHRLQLQPP